MCICCASYSPSARRTARIRNRPGPRLPIRRPGYRRRPSSGDAPGELDEESADRLFGSAPELLHHYWRGSYLLEKRTASALAGAAEQFEAALRIDREDVPALIGLARAHALQAEYWYAPGSYAFPKAKAAIVRALEIDPSSAEARATLGNILLFCDWNWVDAEREIETAMRLNPRSASVYVQATWSDICRGGAEKLLRQLRRSLFVEPSSPPLQLFIARTFLHSGEYGRAIDAFTNLIERPRFFDRAPASRASLYSTGNRPKRSRTCCCSRRIAPRISRCACRCSDAPTPTAAIWSAPTPSTGRCSSFRARSTSLVSILPRSPSASPARRGARAPRSRINDREPALLHAAQPSLVRAARPAFALQGVLRAIWPESVSSPRRSPYPRSAMR